MASVIIPHFCSILRCLGRPRLLTRLAGLPTGRPRSSVPPMLSRNLLHIRRAIPMDRIVRREDPVCTPRAKDTLPLIDQAAPPGGAVLCSEVSPLGPPSGSRWRCRSQSRRRPFGAAPEMLPCLIAAINAANANGEANTIRLAAGTYTLTAVDNVPPGSGTWRKWPPGDNQHTDHQRSGGRDDDHRRGCSEVPYSARCHGWHPHAPGAHPAGGLRLPGGGLFNSGTVTLRHCTLTENEAIRYGRWHFEPGDAHPPRQHPPR